jgi:hypothetical protein
MDSYQAQHSPRNQRDDEPVAHRRWRATASFQLLCHSLNYLSDFENERPWALARYPGIFVNGEHFSENDY